MGEQLLSVGIDIGTSLPRTGTPVRGSHWDFHILGGSEFRLRGICAELRFHGQKPAPRCGAPVVEVPQ